MPKPIKHRGNATEYGIVLAITLGFGIYGLNALGPVLGGNFKAVDQMGTLGILMPKGDAPNKPGRGGLSPGNANPGRPPLADGSGLAPYPVPPAMTDPGMGDPGMIRPDDLPDITTTGGNGSRDTVRPPNVEGPPSPPPTRNPPKPPPASGSTNLPPDFELGPPPKVPISDGDDMVRIPEMPKTKAIRSDNRDDMVQIPELGMPDYGDDLAGMPQVRRQPQTPPAQ